MSWSYRQYKANEARFRLSLFSASGLTRPVRTTAAQLIQAADAVRKSGKTLDDDVMHALNQTISSREKALEFYGYDEGHGNWISVLRDKSENLQEILRHHDQAAGRWHPASIEYSVSPINDTVPPRQTRSYDDSAEDTAVINSLQTLAELREWVKALWAETVNGTVDFVTTDQACNIARDFAHRILSELSMTTNWRSEPRYVKYAQKIGLLESKTEEVTMLTDDSMCVKLLSTNQTMRVHIYNFSAEISCNNNRSPAVCQHLMDKNESGELDRWLFCGAICGWDSATGELKLSLQEKGLLAALWAKLDDLSEVGARENYPADLLGSQDAMIHSCTNYIKTMAIGPDPWTLCHLISQVDCMVKLAEWALCAPYAFRLAYGQRYRQLLSGDDQSPKQDFQCYLPNIKLATPAEVLRSYSFELTSEKLQARLRKTAPWGWRFGREDQLPTILKRFSQSTNYVAILDELRAELIVDNQQRLCHSFILRAVAALRDTDSSPETRLKNSKFTGPIYTTNCSVQFVTEKPSRDVSWIANLSDPRCPAEIVRISVPESAVRQERNPLPDLTPLHLNLQFEDSINHVKQPEINAAAIELLQGFSVKE